MASVILKARRNSLLRYRHPWIFSGAISRIKGDPQSGETVEILTSDSGLAGYGAFSPYSQIRVRLWTTKINEAINEDFFRGRLSRAIGARHFQGPEFAASATRLVYGEADSIPGLIVDRYGDFLVCQFLSAGTEYWRATLVGLLQELTGCQGIFERSDADVRQKEGLESRIGVLVGSEPPELIEIGEGPFRFLVDIRQGHKTGFYLDQRENRPRVGAYAAGAEVLDCFSYTGGFTVAALAGGAARVVSVDSSAAALALVKRHIELNGLDPTRWEGTEGKVADLLRKYRDSRRRFDMIMLDPPKFARSVNQLEQAGRGYKDINMLALKLLNPGGILATFSCSQLMSAELFQRTIAFAALDAGCDVQVIERLHQAPDHPVALNFPEAEYLKGLICRVWPI